MTRLHFYPESDFLIGILFLRSLRHGMLVPDLFHGMAESSDNGTLVLYGGKALIRCGSTKSVRRSE